MINELFNPDNRWVFYKKCGTFEKAQQEAARLEKKDKCETLLVNEQDSVVIMSRKNE